MTTTVTARPRIAFGRALVLGSAVSLVLAGCSDSDSSSDDEQPLGAIDKLYEELYGDWDEETSNAQQMRVEELVSECMAREGFQYTPVDWSQGAVSVAYDDDEIQWGTIEFAKEYGYGITTNPWEEEQPVDQPVDEWVDPNQEYVMAMSETEQQAYYGALYGTSWDEPWEGDDEDWVPPSWEEQGCYGYANHEVYGDSWFGSDDDPFASLNEEMQRMWESIAEDERILAAESKWASCMADAGYPNLAKVGDAEQEFWELVDPIWNDAYSDMPMDATEEDYRAVEQQIQDQLAALTPQEIETATADFTCRDKVGYDDAYTQVNLDVQQRFYDEHRAELEEWLAYQQELMQ